MKIHFTWTILRVKCILPANPCYKFCLCIVFLDFFRPVSLRFFFLRRNIGMRMRCTTVRVFSILGKSWKTSSMLLIFPLFRWAYLSQVRAQFLIRSRMYAKVVLQRFSSTLEFEKITKISSCVFISDEYFVRVDSHEQVFTFSRVSTSTFCSS